eukprot:COSAG05_NODE_2350_length_3195_cov_2.770995_1_plen_57_part_10
MFNPLLLQRRYMVRDRIYQTHTRKSVLLSWDGAHQHAQNGGFGQIDRKPWWRKPKQV